MKKVMPSKFFSEMIKILENFLSFLDFALSCFVPLLIADEHWVTNAFSGHKIAWVYKCVMLVSSGRSVVSLDQLLALLDRLSR